MATSSPSGDHSPQVNRSRGHYGGSDRTAAFFRAPQYVKYNSTTKAKDLGAHRQFEGSFSGAIGSIDGTNTHFYRITLLNDARLGARLVGAQNCALDWLCLHLAHPDGTGIPLGPSGFADADPILIEPESSRDEWVIAAFETYVSYSKGSYAEGDYFNDELVLLSPDGTTETVNYNSWLYQRSLDRQVTPDSIAELASRAPLASRIPAGTYVLTISTSRWHTTPYTLQLVVLEGTSALEGQLDLLFSPDADTGVLDATGDHLLQLAPSGRLKDVIDLGPSADLQFAPRAGLAVTSPIA